MSGRGRGRGRGGGTLSASRLMLKRTALEAGLDDRAVYDITRPPLFPDFTWHSSGRMWTDETEGTKELQVTKRSSSQVYMISKQRELSSKFQESPHYVSPSQQVDIERYNKRSRDKPADTVVIESIQYSLAHDPRYVPPELLDTAIGRSSASPKQRKTLNVHKLEELEQRERERIASQNEQEDEFEEGLMDDPEEEEAEDYTMNYYESEDESDGDDGGEATF